MKSLTNATNGFMVISDSFTTAIFKQSFLRTLGKDENGFLQMGFNGTFDVIVRMMCMSDLALNFLLTTNLARSTDHERDQNLRCHRPRHLYQQKVCECRRNGDWNWTDFSLEGLLAYAKIVFGCLFRGGDARWSTVATGRERTRSIRHPLPARFGSISPASHDRCQGVCRGWSSIDRRVL